MALEIAPDLTVAPTSGTALPEPSVSDGSHVSGRDFTAQTVSSLIGPEAGEAFGTMVDERGWQPALAALEAREFGELRPDAPVSYDALVANAHIAQAADVQAGGPTLLARAGGALDWVLGVLQGDFNEDPSLSQTIASTVLTAIPGIDQVADARDVIANAIKIYEDPTDRGAWIGAALTGVGLVPTAGSLAKGALKAILQTDDVADIAQAFRRLGIEDPGRFLLDNARGLGASARGAFNDTLDAVANALDGISGLHPALAGAAGDLRQVRRDGGGMFAQATQHIEERISYVANRLPTRPGNPENVGRALADAGFTRARQFTFGGNEVTLNRDGLNHILQDHHPRFWQNDPNRTASLTTFFGRDQSVGEIVDIAESVLRQNRDTVAGMTRGGQVSANVDGVEYVLGLRPVQGGGPNQYQVGQLYPVDPMR